MSGGIGLVAFGYGGAMAEVVETHDLTAPTQDGWAVDYRIRREDGEELHAEVRCWEKRTLLLSGQQTLTLLRRSLTAAAPLRESTRSSWSPRRHVARC